MFCCTCLAVTAVLTYYFLDWLIRRPRVGNYSNKHVLITGCRGGFGRDLVLRLDKMGFHVWASFHSQNGIKALEEECSSRVRTLVLDITDDASIRAAYDRIRKELPDDKSLWAVVNNSAVTGPMNFVEMISKQDFLDTYLTNTLGPMELSKVFAPLLRKSRGRLVLMSSAAGRVAGLFAPYAMSKFALEAGADILRHELRSFGVQVSVIEPGAFNTGLIESSKHNQRTREGFRKADPEVQKAYTLAWTEKAMCESVARLSAMASNDIGKVTNAYVDALTSRWPRTRYVVGVDARMGVFSTLLPTWAVDFTIEKAMY